MNCGEKEHAGNMTESIDQTADMIAKAKKVVVFTGAGISTESGIPDFRVPADCGQNMIRMILPSINFWGPTKQEE